MAYGGFLVKVGDYTIPMNEYIKHSSYSVYRAVLDLDSYRNANGKLRREALDHTPIKVEFETPPGLTNIQFAEFMSAIRGNYVNERERKVLGTAYVPELDSYVTQEMYLPDPKPSIYLADENEIIYNAIRIALIGY